MGMRDNEKQEFIILFGKHSIQTTHNS